MKKLFFAVAITLLVVSVAQTYRLFPSLSLSSLFKQPSQALSQLGKTIESQKVVYEESVITDVVQKSLPSVVTIGIIKTQQDGGFLEINPFDPFSPFRRIPGTQKRIDQNIGSGFIVSSDGLIITNKHVVSDTEATYKVLTNDNQKFNVEKIYRDPLNDLAILKINASNLKALPLGDSGSLKLGQMAIAIGTPLGEFPNTITVGIVSGLGRGITAGSPYEGYVEKLDGVIQTDAAISPGNSGGPLLNSKGQVIGVNSAIAAEGQNIGFALPVNIVKELLKNFEARGSSFERPYLGIRYQMIDRKTAIMNSLPEGAYVESVVDGSPASSAGVQADDIITAIDGQKLSSDQKKDLAQVVADKRVGQTVKLTIWRNGEAKEINVTLEVGK